MSGGEVTDGTRRLHLRIIQVLLACGLLVFICWIVVSFLQRGREADRLQKMKEMSELLLAYSSIRDSSTALQPIVVTKLFGEETMVRYCWIPHSANPAPSQIILIERPEYAEGDWCFAAYGDGQVMKMRPAEAAHIVRLNGSQSSSSPTRQ